MDTAIFYKHLYSIKNRLAYSSDYSVDDMRQELRWLERRFALRRHLASHRYMKFEDWRKSGAPDDAELTVLMSKADLDRLDIPSVEAYASEDYVKSKYPNVNFIGAEAHEESKKPITKPLEEAPTVEEEVTTDTIDQIEAGSSFKSDLLKNPSVQSDLEPLRGGIRVFSTITLKMPTNRSLLVSAGNKSETIEPGQSFTVVCGLDVKLNAMEQVFTILGGMGGSADRMSKSALETARRVIGEVNYIGLDGRNETHLSLPSFQNEVDKVVDESIRVYAIGKDADSLLSIRTESGESSLTWSQFNKATHTGNSLTHHLLNNVRNSLFTSDPKQVKEWLKEVDKPIEKSGFVAKFSKSLGNTDVLKSFFETDEAIEKDYLKSLDVFIQDYLDRLLDKRGKDASQVFRVYRSALESLALNPTGKKELTGNDAKESIDKAKADVRAFVTYDAAKASEVIRKTVKEAVDRGLMESNSAKIVDSYLSDENNLRNFDKHLDQINKLHYDRIPQEGAVKVALNRLQPGLYEEIRDAFESKGIRGGVHTLMKLSGADKIEAIDILDDVTKKEKKSGSNNVKATIEFIETSGLESIYGTGVRRKLPALYILIKNVTDANAPVGYSQTDPQYSSRTAWRSAQHTVELGKLLDEYSNLGVRTNANRASINAFIELYSKEYSNDPDVKSATDRLETAEKAVRSDYLADPASNKNASMETMLEECDPAKAEAFKVALNLLDEVLEGKINQNQNKVPESFKRKFKGIEKYETVSEAFAHLLDEKTKIENESSTLKQNLRDNAISAAKPFLGLAGNPMMQLSDHVNKSMGTSVPIRRIDNSGPANIKDLKSYMKSGKVNEIVYGVIGLSYKHARGANTAKPRKPGRGISLYSESSPLRNKSATLSNLEKIVGKLAALKKAVIEVTKAYDTYKMSPHDQTQVISYESAVNKMSGLTEDIRKLNKDDLGYVNEITKAADVYVRSPQLMDNSAISGISSEVTNLHPNRSDAGSVLFSGIDQVTRQLKSTIEYLKSAAKPKQSDIFVNEYSISPDEADQMLFRIFNWFPSKFDNLNTAIKQAKNFASNKYDRGEGTDYKSTLMGLWMLEGDQEAMTEAAKKAVGTERTDVRGTRKTVESGGFTSPNLAVMKTSPEPSMADVRHAVHILVGYLGGSLHKREFSSLNKRWQDYIISILKDAKFGPKRWADLLGVMKDYGFWVDVASVEDAGSDPSGVRKGLEVVAYKTDLSLALSITAIAYLLEAKFPPSETTLKNVTDWINSEDQRTIKSSLSHLVLHVPELIDLGDIRKLKDPQNLSEALKSWKTVKAEEGFDLKRYIEDLEPHIKDWARQSGLNFTSLKSQLLGGAAVSDPLNVVKSAFAKLQQHKTMSGATNPNMGHMFEEMTASTLRILNPASLEGQAKVPGALGRYLGLVESQKEIYESFLSDLTSDAKVTEQVNSNTNSKIKTINQRRHSWTGPAVAPISGSPPPNVEWYLYGHKYANEAEWEKDKDQVSKSVNQVIDSLKTMMSSMEDLPGTIGQ